MSGKHASAALAADGLPRFGTGAFVIDDATVRRIRDMAERVEQDGLPLRGCMEHAINIAQEWTKRTEYCASKRFSATVLEDVLPNV